MQPLIGWTPRRTVGFRRFGGDMGWLAGVGALMGVSWAVSGAEFWTGGANICLRPARFRSGGRSSPVEPGQALHVVGEIGEADLGGCGGALPLIPNTPPPHRRVAEQNANPPTQERALGGRRHVQNVKWRGFTKCRAADCPRSLRHSSAEGKKHREALTQCHHLRGRQSAQSRRSYSTGRHPTARRTRPTSVGRPHPPRRWHST